ncbi:hypothetical protein COLO4_31615 [Corchorus olitorius]|uniref:Kelch repeat type 1 n=1 Tax=Corchorus olitorius TaxID=93759 RepID=A0A1R3H3V0_9ROSI|nr:hypothetical protein COLO4_31615 [Corchorus olitorius]
MESASEAKRQKTENMEEASDAKRQKLENLVTLQELEATSNQNQTEGETGIIQFTPVRRGKIENMNFFLRNCPSSRQPCSHQLTATSTEMCLNRKAGLIQFSPICRGYIILWLQPKTEDETAQHYAIQFCTSRDNFKHPLSNIKEIDSRFMNLKALPVTHMSYSVADREGNRFSCLSKKVTVNGDKGSLACVPPMQREKVGPLSVVLDGKLYVMGTYYTWDESKEPWGEIFDPRTMQWRSMPSPPFRYCHHYLMFAAPFEEERKILIGGDEQLEIFSFNVDEESWELYDIPDHNAYLPMMGQSIVSRGILYSVNQYLYAYDLRNRLFCKATPAEMGLVGEGYDDWFKGKKIHDLGNNNLCLVWMLDDCNSVELWYLNLTFASMATGLPIWMSFLRDTRTIN